MGDSWVQRGQAACEMPGSPPQRDLQDQPDPQVWSSEEGGLETGLWASSHHRQGRKWTRLPQEGSGRRGKRPEDPGWALGEAPQGQGSRSPR